MCAVARAPSPPHQLRDLAPGRVATEKSPGVSPSTLASPGPWSRLGALAGLFARASVSEQGFRRGICSVQNREWAPVPWPAFSA